MADRGCLCVPAAEGHPFEMDSGSGFSGGAQGREECFEFVAALSTHVEVFLHERHGLGGGEAGELHRHEAVQLFEALVAADLAPVVGLGYLLYHRFEDCFVYRLSFVPVPGCTPRSIDAPGR